MSITHTAEVRKARLNYLDKIINKLSKEERRAVDPRQSCRNCYNLGTTVIPLGLYWAERRCHYCDNYSEWSHVLELRDEVAEAEVVEE